MSFTNQSAFLQCQARRKSLAGTPNLFMRTNHKKLIYYQLSVPFITYVRYIA